MCVLNCGVSRRSPVALSAARRCKRVVLVAIALGLPASGRQPPQHETRCPGEEPYVSGRVAALCDEHFPRNGAPDRGRWIVNFYGAHCRRCAEVAPAVVGAAELGHQTTAQVLYGAVDCHHSTNKDLCKAEGIWKLPTIRALGEGVSYGGAHEVRSLHEWAVSVVRAVVAPQTSDNDASSAVVAPLCPAYELYDEPRVAREFLRAHNIYRCTAGLELLTWDVKAFATAKRWASIAPTDKLQHSPEEQRRAARGNVYGENVAIGEGLQPGLVVARWHGEIRGTPGGRGGAPLPPRGGLGHYTQLVWRRTRRVGCSLAQNRRVAVCHYDPAGNEKGRHLTQVAHPLPGYAGPEGEKRCGGLVDQIFIEDM